MLNGGAKQGIAEFRASGSVQVRQGVEVDGVVCAFDVTKVVSVLILGEMEGDGEGVCRGFRGGSSNDMEDGCLLGIEGSESEGDEWVGSG